MGYLSEICNQNNNQNCPFACIKGLELVNSCILLLETVTLTMASLYHWQPEQNLARPQRQPGLHSPTLDNKEACRQGGKRQRPSLHGQPHQKQL